MIFERSQGSVSDFASPSERAGFIGFANLGPTSAPAIGPLIGAVITQTVGWHAIFIVLAVACGVVWLALLVFLPETLRARVGDGKQVPCPTRRVRSLTGVWQARIRPTGFCTLR